MSNQFSRVPSGVTPHCISIFWIPVLSIIGAVVSWTVIDWIKVVVLSQSSFKDQVRVITDAFAQLPLAIVSVYIALKLVEQLSTILVTYPVISRSVASTSHSIVISAGAVNVGAVVSITLMVCICVVVLLQSSVRDQVRVIVSELAQLPLAILSE